MVRLRGPFPLNIRALPVDKTPQSYPTDPPSIDNNGEAMADGWSKFSNSDEAGETTDFSHHLPV